MWDEYTEEEKAQLPPLNPKRIESGDTNYMWNGKFWEYVPLDWQIATLLESEEKNMNKDKRAREFVWDEIGEWLIDNLDKKWKWNETRDKIILLTDDDDDMYEKQVIELYNGDMPFEEYVQKYMTFDLDDVIILDK